jgi:hypothetical protein
MLQVALAVAPWLCLGLVFRAALRLGSEPRAADERARFWPALQQGVSQLAGWTLLGLLAASYAAAFIAKDATGLSAPARLGWSALATALSFASAPAAAPLAAVLVGLGLPFGAALAVLLLGPIAKLLSSRSTAAATVPRSRLALTTLGGAVLAAAMLGDPSIGAGDATRTQLPGYVQWLLLVSLLGFVARSIWTTGMRSWLQAGLAPTAARGARAGHSHAWTGPT